MKTFFICVGATSDMSPRRSLRVPVQIVLQDDGRRCRVQPSFAFSPVTLPLREAAFGLYAGQTLVLVMNGERDALTQPRDESRHFHGSGGWSTVEPRRHADYDSIQAVGVGRQPLDFADNALHGRIALDRQRRQRPRERPRRVADGKPDAPPPKVDAEDSHTPML